jgi:hypothetical protein
MVKKLIIAGWGGVVPGEANCPTVRQIASDEARYQFLHASPIKAARILYALQEIGESLSSYGKDPMNISLLTGAYNVFALDILQGMPRERVSASIRRYATKARRRMDAQTFDAALNAAADCSEYPLHIITPEIDQAVRDASAKLFRGFDTGSLAIQGSHINFTDDLADSVMLNQHLFGEDAFLDLARRKGLNPSDVSYMGGGIADESIAQVAGAYVVPPSATDEQRQFMASRYGKAVRTPEKSVGSVYRALAMD